MKLFDTQTGNFIDVPVDHAWNVLIPQGRYVLFEDAHKVPQFMIDWITLQMDGEQRKIWEASEIHIFDGIAFGYHFEPTAYVMTHEKWDQLMCLQAILEKEDV